MNLEFSEDQKFVQQTARDYLSQHAGLEVCRGVLESDRPYDADLWKGVAEMGWLGTALPEELGGAGMGELELLLIAEEVGRALAPIPFGSSVYGATEALQRFGSEAQRKKHLPALAGGERIGTLALAEGPGEIDARTAEGVKLEGGRLTGEKWPVLDGDVAGLAVVLARGPEGPSLVLCDLEGEGVSRTPLESFDPSRSQAKLAFSGAPAEPLGEAGRGAELLDELLDRAAVLYAFEQLGGATRALEITKEFAMGRYAFGRPIASFQALKHRFAELYAKIELARSNGYYAAWALDSGSDELRVAAASARVAASEAFQLAAEEMLQIHGGVGFTWEYDCHLFYRRAVLLGSVLGDAAQWREKLVDRLEARERAA